MSKDVHIRYSSGDTESIYNVDSVVFHSGARDGWIVIKRLPHITTTVYERYVASIQVVNHNKEKDCENISK